MAVAVLAPADTVDGAVSSPVLLARTSMVSHPRGPLALQAHARQRSFGRKVGPGLPL